jgi:hypothetical protein
MSVLLASCIAMSFETPTGPDFCAGPTESCSLFLKSADAPSTGTVASADGTVIRYRLDYAFQVPGYSISVVRGNPNGTYTVTATSPEVTPLVGPQVETFDVDLPIKAGEYIALNIPAEGFVGAWEGAGSFFGVGFAGRLTTGETASPVIDEPATNMIGFNADIAYGPPALVIPPEIRTEVRTVEVPKKEAHCVAPKLQGKKLKVAKAQIRAAGCKVGLVSQKRGVKAATAKVVAQSPKPATTLLAGTPISLKLG